MKRRMILILLAVSLLLTLAISALAVTPRALVITPLLHFTGTTANCGLNVTIDSTSDIDAVVKLWDNLGVCRKKWTPSGTGYIIFRDSSYTGISGKTYTLTADVTVNGEVQPRVSTDSTCP